MIIPLTTKANQSKVMRTAKRLLVKNNVEYSWDHGVEKNMVNEIIMAIERTKLFLQNEYHDQIRTHIQVVLFSSEKAMEEYLQINKIDGLTHKQIAELSKYPALTISARDSNNRPEAIILRNINKAHAGLDKVFIIAHELAHVWQAELAQQYNFYEIKWLAEGMADVFAANVLEQELAYQAIWLDIAKEYLNKIWLKSLHTPKGFQAEVEKYNMQLVYRIADLATLSLKRNYGMEAIIHYFSTIGVTHHADKSFKNVFGISPNKFEEQFSMGGLNL
jgi:hypothetical protein